MAENRRRTARRQYESRKSNSAFWFIIVFELFVIFALGFALRVNSNKLSELSDSVNKEEVRRDLASDSLGHVYTKDGTPIFLYVIKNPDDGTEWVVSDRGGVYPRP